LYEAPGEIVRSLPSQFDLREHGEFPPVYNQGRLQSCTANAVAAAIQFLRRKEALQPDFVPSRLFIYYNVRALRGDISCDNGAQIRDSIKSVAARGVCEEALWPYRFARFENKPRPRCYHAAAAHRAIRYQRIGRDLRALKACLVSGYPFVFGMAVFEELESAGAARSGAVRTPKPGERRIGHGHAVLAVGYDEARGHFIVRNSWGEDWGKRGYFTLPFDYLTEPGLSSDFWTIRRESH
jgi:C1A family cysteine protease